MINQVVLLGFVGQEPTVKDVDGRKVANFSMATSESYKKENEYVNVTEWHNVVFWGNVANYIANSVSKGSIVSVIGKLKTRSYEDKDGVKRYVTEIVGDKVQVVKPKGDAASTASSPSAVDIDSPSIPEEDLPF
jgi:single-strand DNA-binding protein